MEGAEAGETAQKLRTLAAVTDDQSLVPAPTSGSSQQPVASIPGDLMSSSGLCGHLHRHGMHSETCIKIKLNLKRRFRALLNSHFITSLSIHLCSEISI